MNTHHRLVAELARARVAAHGGDHAAAADKAGIASGRLRELARKGRTRAQRDVRRIAVATIVAGGDASGNPEAFRAWASHMIRVGELSDVGRGQRQACAS